MIEITQVNPINKGSLVAALNVKFPKWGDFYIRGIKVFEKNNSRWVSMPSQLFERDGKKSYTYYCGFDSKETHAPFEKEILEKFDEYCKTNKPAEPSFYSESMF